MSTSYKRLNVLYTYIFAYVTIYMDNIFVERGKDRETAVFLSLV